MEHGPSALELLHPNGVARHALVLGGGCPEVLRPRRPEPGARQLADLVVLAPTAGELREPNWLENAVAAAADLLAPDGVVYVISPPRGRARFTRLLAARDIDVKVAFAHDPSTAGPRSLVPISLVPATYAFTNLIATRPGRRRLVLSALRARPVARLLSRILPQAGLAAGRRTSRPLFTWLFASEETPVSAPLAVVSVGRNGCVAHGFENGAATPAIVAKVGSSEDSGPAGEADLLERLGRGARAAGAAVPEVLLVDRDERRTILFESPVEGRLAAALLGETPALLPGLSRRLVDWLESWNLDTRSEQVLTETWLEHEIGRPARALAPALADGGRYLGWVESRCAAVAGTTVPFVATHNDLTMVNVFVSRSGSLGIVDWESARTQGLPLVDFYYAAADAASAADRYADRVASFSALFGGAAPDAATRMLERRVVDALGLPRAVVELAFHACWIHHAAEEQRAGADSAPQPFLEILRSVAETTS